MVVHFQCLSCCHLALTTYVDPSQSATLWHKFPNLFPSSEGKKHVACTVIYSLETYSLIPFISEVSIIWFLSV